MNMISRKPELRRCEKVYLKEKYMQPKVVFLISSVYGSF